MEEFNLPNTLVEKVVCSHQEALWLPPRYKKGTLYGPVDLLINNVGQCY